MDAHAQAAFLRELRLQAFLSLHAILALEQVSKKRLEIDRTDLAARQYVHNEHFRTIHSFLTHLSNVSRIIWPPSYKSGRCDCKKKEIEIGSCNHCLSRSRAATIQKELGLLGVDHVLQSRTLRDHLEHFDERLDDWQSKSARRNYVQDHIGAKEDFEGVDAGDRMRQFDPARGEFTFRGETFSLLKLKEGAEDIIDRSEKALTRSGYQF